MKLTTIITVLVIAAGSAVWADTPSTRPTPEAKPTTQPQAKAQYHANEQRLKPGQIRRMVLRMFSGGPTAGVKPPTQQEWDEMMDFMQQNSPARWHVLSTLNLPPDSQIRLDAIRKWRNYTFTRDHLPAVADQLVQRFQIEDDLFAITLTAQENADLGLDEFYDKIHAKVEKLVELDFAERQTRIDKLEKLLDEEKTKLAHDQAMEEKTIDQRTNAILARLDKMNRNVLASTTTRPDGDQEASGQQPAKTGTGNSDQPTINISNATESGGSGK
jgi:hypothetical protein